MPSFGLQPRLGCLAHRPSQRLKSTCNLCGLRSTPPAVRQPKQNHQWQLRKRQSSCQAAADFAAPAPGAPIAGDNHGALIHQLLSEHSEEVEAYVKEGLREALEDINDGSQSKQPLAVSQQARGGLAGHQSDAGPPEPEGPRQFIPHRWRIIAMMSLAFILCNMDKVCHPLLLPADSSLQQFRVATSLLASKHWTLLAMPYVLVFEGMMTCMIQQAKDQCTCMHSLLHAACTSGMLEVIIDKKLNV